MSKSFKIVFSNPNSQSRLNMAPFRSRKNLSKDGVKNVVGLNNCLPLSGKEKSIIINGEHLSGGAYFNNQKLGEVPGCCLTNTCNNND